MFEALAMVEDHPQCVEIVNRLDPHGHHEGWGVLHWAARLFQGHAWIPELLRLGADASAQTTDGDGPSPLAIGFVMLAFNPRFQQFFHEDLAASETAVRALIDAGSDLEHLNDEGCTVLHFAANFAGHLVPLLLNNQNSRSTVNVVDSFALTPLARALIHQPEVCDLLLDAGADPWLPLPRTDGAFSDAVDLTEKLSSGALGSPHTFSAQEIWSRLLERMRSHELKSA